MDVTVFCEVKSSGIRTGFLRVLLLAPSQYNSTNTPILICTNTLVLSAVQRGEAWGSPRKDAFFFENRHLTEKLFSMFFVLQRQFHKLGC
jgi:hypothetical protein